MPKRKRTERVVAAEISVVETVEVGSVSVDSRPKRTRVKRKPEPEEPWDYPVVPAEDNGNESPLTDIDDEIPNPRKGKGKRRKKKSDEPVVYDIPPVEHKTTDFEGRLGYACLNTVLRATKPEPIFCSRTCRKDTIHKNGIEFAKELGLKNTKDLIKLIEWNEENNIRFLRISSEMFPFASHGELGYDLEYAKNELKAVGDLAKKLGHRLTTHPGQFTQLASPRDAVIVASIRELEYHCQMMRYMGLGSDSVIILHMGGVYNDKPATLARFKETYTTRLTDEMRARLVMENDEMCYSVDDLLPVCTELGVPIVLDYHHNWINPSVIPLQSLIPVINATWHAKGIKPKQHLSSPKPQFADGSGNIMDRRAHADRCYELPPEVGYRFEKEEDRNTDLMIEAKDKEQAVFHLYRIYNLMPVKHENLRPEKPQSATREVDGEGGNVEEMGETPDDEGAIGAKRTRRSKKAKFEAPAQDPKDESPAASKRHRHTKANYPATVCGAEAEVTADRPIKTHDASLIQSEDLASLLNQEDAPQPVDGAPIAVVESEEHPEVVVAAQEDGDGCGVARKRKVAKSRKSSGKRVN